MSYFDEQEDAWFENGCKGNIEDYDPFDASTWPDKHTFSATPTKVRTEAQKARKRRYRAKRRQREAIARRGVSRADNQA